VTDEFPSQGPLGHDPPRRRLLRLGLALVAGAAVACVFLAAMPPAARPRLPLDAVARGEAFEQALAAALTRVRPAGEEWAIAIDPDDINAWLATRLAKWVEHDPALAGLASARSARVASVRGALVLEDADRAPGGAVLSLPVEPSLVDGRLRLDIGLARIGRLPVPGAATALAALLRDGLDGLAAGPAHIRLGDGRRVELRDIACEPGELRLLFATLPAAAQ
jgi:hypothetical protein